MGMPKHILTSRLKDRLGRIEVTVPQRGQCQCGELSGRFAAGRQQVGESALDVTRQYDGSGCWRRLTLDFSVRKQVSCPALARPAQRAANVRVSSSVPNVMQQSSWASVTAIVACAYCSLVAQRVRDLDAGFPPVS
jgi:hypothetical protein